MKLTPSQIALLAAAGLGSVAIGFVLARYGRQAWGVAPAHVPLEGALVLRVPRALGNIVLDGDMDDPGWSRQSARTLAFVGADGVTAARPHSEARLVWADGFLYLGLYAADEDIRAQGSTHDAPVSGDDTFHVVFSDGKVDRVLDVNPLGAITDGTRPAGTNEPLDRGWESGAHVSRESDGTLNKPDDYDEEWVIEMAIPLVALGFKGEPGESAQFSIRRCDTFKSGATSCGTWGEGPKKGVIVLE